MNNVSFTRKLERTIISDIIKKEQFLADIPDFCEVFPYSVLWSFSTGVNVTVDWIPGAEEEMYKCIFCERQCLCDYFDHDKNLYNAKNIYNNTKLSNDSFEMS